MPILPVVGSPATSAYRTLFSTSSPVPCPTLQLPLHHTIVGRPASPGEAGDSARSAGRTNGVRPPAGGGLRAHGRECPAPGRGSGDADILKAAEGLAARKSRREIALEIHGAESTAVCDWGD